MINRIKFALVSTLAAAFALTGLAAVFSTAPAGASDTAQCAATVSAPHGNAPAQWCSGQEDVTLALGLAATNKAAAYAPVTVKPWTTTNGSEDFAVYRAFPSDPSNAQVKIFEYAPRGVMSGLCAAVSNSHARLVFKNCNPANKGQQFQPGSAGADGGVAWDSLLTGQAITIPGGAAFSHLVLGPDAGSVSQSFTYQQ
jgi:hypothetical protein